MFKFIDISPLINLLPPLQILSGAAALEHVTVAAFEY